MTERYPQIEAAIRSSLSRIDDTSAEARQSVYDAALRSLDRQLSSRGEEGSERARLLHERLEATIRSVEESYVNRLLVEELDDVPFVLSDVNDAATENDQTMDAYQPMATSRAKNHRSMLLWSAGLALVAGAIGSLVYVVSMDQSPTLDGAVAYDASPPFPLLHGEAYATSLNKAAKFVSISNKAARTAESGLLPSVTLASDLEDKFSGKTIDVTVSARLPGGTADGSLVAIYYTDGVGNSGPRTFPLSAEYSDVSFTYDVPARVGEPGEDYLGVAPASPDANASIDVRSIRIRLKPAS